MRTACRHRFVRSLYLTSGLLLWASLVQPLSGQTAFQDTTAVLLQWTGGLDFEERVSWLPDLWLARRGEWGQKRWVVADGVMPITTAVDSNAFASAYLGFTDPRDLDLEMLGPVEQAWTVVSPLFHPAALTVGRDWRRRQRPRTRVRYASGATGLSGALAQHTQSFGRKLTAWFEGASRGYEGEDGRYDARGYLFQGRLIYRLNPKLTLRFLSRKSVNEETVQPSRDGGPSPGHEKLLSLRHTGRLDWRYAPDRHLSLTVGYQREMWEERSAELATERPGEFTLWTLRTTARRGSWHLSLTGTREEISGAASRTERAHVATLSLSRSIDLGRIVSARADAGGSIFPGSDFSPLVAIRLGNRQGQILWQGGVEHRPFLISRECRRLLHPGETQRFARRLAGWLQIGHVGGGHDFGLRLTRSLYRHLPLIEARLGEGGPFALLRDHTTTTLSIWAGTRGAGRFFGRFKSLRYTNPAPGYPDWTTQIEAGARDTLFAGDLKLQLSARLEVAHWKTSAVPVSQSVFQADPAPGPTFLLSSLVLLAQYRNAVVFLEVRWAPEGYREALPGFEVEPLFLRWGVDVVLWD